MQNDYKHKAKKLFLGTIYLMFIFRISSSSGCSNKRVTKQWGHHSSDGMFPITQQGKKSHEERHKLAKYLQLFPLYFQCNGRLRVVSWLCSAKNCVIRIIPQPSSCAMLKNTKYWYWLTTFIRMWWIITHWFSYYVTYEKELIRIHSYLQQWIGENLYFLLHQAYFHHQKIKKRHRTWPQFRESL